MHVAAAARDGAATSTAAMVASRYIESATTNYESTTTNEHLGLSGFSESVCLISQLLFSRMMVPKHRDVIAATRLPPCPPATAEKRESPQQGGDALKPADRVDRRPP